MTTQYELSVTATCPVDPSIVDSYAITIEMSSSFGIGLRGLVLGSRSGMAPVEEILELLAELTADPVFQEDLTDKLARKLRATVTTVGIHSGVKTTCTCS